MAKAENKQIVLVLDKHRKPLMPTTRCGHVRYLLDSGRAVVVKKNPFTIKLKYESTTETQQIILGVDPGRTNIGMTSVDNKGNSLHSVHGITNNKDIPKRMEKRAAHRRASRSGERKRRRRRAREHGTTFGTKERILPGCEKPIVCKDIINSESRFHNRIRPAGWLTPTARQLLQVHISMVKQQMKLLPITDIVIEVNQFAFMAMDNPNIKRWEYQRGPLYGYGKVEDAVYTQQEGHCIFCEKQIQNYHHVIPKSKGGSNTFQNLAGLCSEHHDLVHKEQEWTDKLKDMKAGLNKKYHTLSVLNQIIPYLMAELDKLFPGHVYVTDGYSTKTFRDENRISKDHHLDAYCIACSILESVTVDPPTIHYEMNHFRRHDRAAVSRLEERKYYYDGKVVARNRRKRVEQKTDSLEEYRAKHPEHVSHLKVKKGLPVYKRKNRIMPGSIFLVNGQELVLRGNHGKTSSKGLPTYFEFIGKPDYVTPRNCQFLRTGGGWQYV